MYKHIYWFFFMLLLYLPANSQVASEITALNRVTINRQDTLYTFFAKKPVNEISINKGKSYYWYNGDTILITREGYDGRVLDGIYKVYYPNKNLKELVSFTNGLKDGEWKYWYQNGELASVEKWKDGLLQINKKKKSKEKKKPKKSTKKAD